jgi:hypothetical protein
MLNNDREPGSGTVGVAAELAEVEALLASVRR